MKWEHSLNKYIEWYGPARHLQATTLHAYRAALEQCIAYLRDHCRASSPEQVTTVDILGYMEHLRVGRGNGASSLNRTVAIIKEYYRALVNMEYMAPGQNPMRGFPQMKPPHRKFRDVLNNKEIEKLLNRPRKDTVLGIRDRTLLVLLLNTGIRASECAGMKEKDVRLHERTIRVTGKGGDERTIPLDEIAARALMVYRKVRGELSAKSCFFKSRKGGGLSRHGIYERVRTYARQARIKKKVTPHILRHTFATRMLSVRKVNLVVLKELLGHRQLASTQIYVHMTANDLREAMKHHPLRKLAAGIVKYLPNIKMPFQHPPGTRFAFQSP